MSWPPSRGSDPRQLPKTLGQGPDSTRLGHLDRYPEVGVLTPPHCGFGASIRESGPPTPPTQWHGVGTWALAGTRGTEAPIWGVVYLAGPPVRSGGIFSISGGIVSGSPFQKSRLQKPYNKTNKQLLAWQIFVGAKDAR